MTPRVLISGTRFVAGESIALPDDVAHHLVRVLRLSAGAPLVCFDGDGQGARASLVSTKPVLARIDALLPPEPATLPITLAQCISTADKMDWTIEKAVELGATRIVPLMSARSVVRLDARRSASREAHWGRIIIAAAAQSGRCRLPTLAPVTPIIDWLASESLADGRGWLLDPVAAASLAGAVRAAPPDCHHRLLCGPEAGFSPEELAAANAQGWTGVRMGPRVLRTETAGLAAISIIQSQAGDLR
jgi:16S rRNA (uracil1498-N3)-methyltransferase